MDSKAPTLLGDRENSTTPSYAPSVQKEYQPTSDNSSTIDKENGSTLEAATGDVSAEPEDNGVYPTGLRMASIVVALVLSIFLVSLDLTIVGTAIPAITVRTSRQSLPPPSLPNPN